MLQKHSQSEGQKGAKLCYIFWEKETNKTKQDKNKEYTEVSRSAANAKFKSRNIISHVSRKWTRNKKLRRRRRF